MSYSVYLRVGMVTVIIYSLFRTPQIAGIIQYLIGSIIEILIISRHLSHSYQKGKSHKSIISPYRIYMRPQPGNSAIGEPGLGKSQTALWLACKYDGIYIRASNLMTSRWLVEEIVREMDELPRYLTSDNFNVVISKLIQKPKIIFVDEIDYLINNYKSVETLRDIHDKTDCPIVFVGMGLALRKLERYKHLYDRFSEIVKLETFEIEDLSQIFSQLSEIPFTPDSIEYIHKKYNRFRQIVQLISKLESFAKENNLEEITKEVMEQII